MNIPMWGTFWVWDARLTSVFISFLIYLGALRFQKLPVEPAPISIRAGPIDIPIIKSSVNWWNTLHQPGSISRSETSDASKSNWKCDYVQYVKQNVSASNVKYIGLMETKWSKISNIQKIARDFLVVPISTVASESSFCIDGRVLSSHCSSSNITHLFEHVVEDMDDDSETRTGTRSPRPAPLTSLDGGVGERR
ncbi:putative cytochrome c biosynthesis ccmC-like mitochondrial protein [Glycine soja]